MSSQVPVDSDPAQVGPYVVERRLGAGGMGTVYLAQHETTRKEAAVKVLAPTLARDEGLVARFMREIDAMHKLKNPHVVELYDHGIDGPMHYYAMEYVAGETLTARLRREKRLDWKEVIELSSQICVALKAAHDAGIIHRDLKPSNLLLTQTDQIKLTDFGVAQVFAGSKLTMTGGVIGTAEYMSPEQAQGQRITKRSDLYSLGAVMYVMLTGRPPFSGKSTLEVIQKHKYGRFDRPRLVVPDMPLWLDEIVCQLLEKEPDKRFADAYVVNRRLKEVVRKVELSTSKGTTGDGQTQLDGSTADAAAPSGSGRASGPGAGTLMRDLFRAEIEAQAAPSAWRRLLENTWVLVGLMALLVIGGFFLIRGGMSPEQRFERGVALLEENEDANWRDVRDQYFAPLTELKSAEWDEKLAPYLKRIRFQERKAALSSRSTRRRFGKAGEPSSEIDRIVDQAERSREAGDMAAAERTLASLVALLEDNPQYEMERKLIAGYLDELRNRSAEQPADRSFVDAAMSRADQLVGQGKRDAAARIWKSVIELYEKDPQSSAEVDRARRNLAGKPEKTSSAKVGP